MPKNCCVVGCTNNSVRRNDLSFYLIPSEATEPHRREKWLQTIGRGVSSSSIELWRPASDYHYVCSSHFIGGKKNNNPAHPDYVPSIFPQNPLMKFTCRSKIERLKRAQKGNRNPLDLYDATSPDWAPSLHLGHEKVEDGCSRPQHKTKKVLAFREPFLIDHQAKFAFFLDHPYCLQDNAWISQANAVLVRFVLPSAETVLKGEPPVIKEEEIEAEHQVGKTPQPAQISAPDESLQPVDDDSTAQPLPDSSSNGCPSLNVVVKGEPCDGDDFYADHFHPARDNSAQTQPDDNKLYEDEPDDVSCEKYEQMKCALSTSCGDILRMTGFSYVASDNITFVMLYDCLNSSLKFSVTVLPNTFELAVFVHQRPLPLPDSIPSKCDSVEKLIDVLYLLSGKDICIGNNDQKFVDLPLGPKSFLEESITPTYRKTVRHTNCQLLLTSKYVERCSRCSELRASLGRKRRALDKTVQVALISYHSLKSKKSKNLLNENRKSQQKIILNVSSKVNLVPKRGRRKVLKEFGMSDVCDEIEYIVPSKF